MVENKKQAEVLVKEWATKCEDEIRSWKGYHNFALAMVKSDWSTRRKLSRGGWYTSAGGPGISLAMNNYFDQYLMPINHSYEYASFDKHSVIGGFYYTKKDSFLRPIMVVVHEVAHAVQFYADRQLQVYIDAPHGESFKKPYAKLRANLFNHLIPKNQHELAAKYNEMLKIKNAKQFIEWERGLQIA